MSGELNLEGLLSALCDDLGYGDATTVSNPVRIRLIRYVNEGYRHILSMPEFSSFRRATLPLVSEANRKVYGFPQTFVQISQIVDITNSIRLHLLTPDSFRTIDPQEVSSGTPTHYVPLGYGPLLRDISAPNVGLYAVSNLPGDVSHVGVYCTSSPSGASPGGLPSPFSNTALTGIVRVEASPLNVVSVQQLESQSTGTVQFWDAAAGGNLMAEIAGGQTTVQYQQIRLWPTPAGVYQYQIDGTTHMNDLSLNGFAFPGIPILPGDFQYVLCDYARMREYEFRDDSRMPIAASQYNAKLKQMRIRIIDPPDYRPRAGQIPDRGSNLGPWFPVGRW